MSVVNPGAGVLGARASRPLAKGRVLGARASRPQHAGGVGFSSIPFLAMTRLAPVVRGFAEGSASQERG